MLNSMIFIMAWKMVKAWELSPAMWHMIYKVDSSNRAHDSMYIDCQSV